MGTVWVGAGYENLVAERDALLGALCLLYRHQAVGPGTGQPGSISYRTRREVEARMCKLYGHDFHEIPDYTSCRRCGYLKRR